MTANTLFWHDYETFGTDPQRDRPAQFAGVRTDLDFNVLEEPLCCYCKTPLDYLPQPDACIITGITPDLVDEQGHCEAEFTQLIHAQLARPNTCTLGYNNLRFDDEVTRNLLYRNFYDPYAREWQNGNSRWDLIDLVRATKALRPEGIVWPVNDEGLPSLKLEALTKENGIEHSAAHDALSDVYATIHLARLIKGAQPKLYDFLWQNRSKTAASSLLRLGEFVPLVHISGMYSAARQYIAIVLPLCKHPSNQNEVIVYDLSCDPEPLLNLSVDDIHQRLFSSSQALPEGVARIAIKTVHINKCPVLAPMSVVRSVDAERLSLDLANCLANRDKIIAQIDLVNAKLKAVYELSAYPAAQVDADLAIYSGGFFSDADKRIMTKIMQAKAEDLAAIGAQFKDKRLNELMFRYRARNYPACLSEHEQREWLRFCLQRLVAQTPATSITYEDFIAQLNRLHNNQSIDATLINRLERYAIEKMRGLGYDLKLEL